MVRVDFVFAPGRSELISKWSELILCLQLAGRSWFQSGQSWFQSGQGYFRSSMLQQLAAIRLFSWSNVCFSCNLWLCLFMCLFYSNEWFPTAVTCWKEIHWEDFETAPSLQLQTQKQPLPLWNQLHNTLSRNLPFRSDLASARINRLIVSNVSIYLVPFIGSS